jgi:two-component system response regulator FlrC
MRTDGAQLIGTSSQMLELKQEIQRIARSDAKVLITGESGVGKEVLARFIHRHSARTEGPFVAINCAAIPENLLEATLFGYEKGAFTGASAPHAGKFEQAQGGTLLLDEISEMPAALQAKLLRVLQEREVERVGGKKPIALDVRMLATSNRDLQAEVQGGRFREDLYYRLNVFPLEVPPLRSRPLDIVPLALRVLQRAGQGRALGLAPAAQAGLTAYGWRGNIRELESVMQRAMILAPGAMIEPEHLWLPTVNATAGNAPAEAARTAAAPLRSGEAARSGEAGRSSGAGSSGEAQKAYPSDLKSLERTHILETLAAVNGVRKAAAERLGMSERTLRYKLAQYRLEAAGGEPGLH